MTHHYAAIAWTPHKRIYDRHLLAILGVYLAVFATTTWTTVPNVTVETVLLRSFGTAALLLLHVILSIGPLCRLDRRFLALLFNRRHLGVVTFLVALVHGLVALITFHSAGNVSPLVSLLVGDGPVALSGTLPFQLFGAAALLVLFLLAATSHDFWLKNLTPGAWKRIHMAVYGAYALLILHVGFGALHNERSRLYGWIFGLGILWLVVIHTLAGWRERRGDRPSALARDGWIEVGDISDIPAGRARVISNGQERIAVFHHAAGFSAVSNVCPHQNGPLGEGAIVDGCITCPWHGYQFRPEDGRSPPPYSEKIPTFRVRVAAGRVWVDGRPLAPGTFVAPARADTRESKAIADE